jgi:hypothetical protein
MNRFHWVFAVFLALMGACPAAGQVRILQSFSVGRSDGFLGIERVPGGPYGPWGLVWTPDGPVIADRAAGKLIRLDSDGRIRSMIPVPGRLDSLAAGPGGRLAVRSADRVHILQAGEDWQSIPLPDGSLPWRGLEFGGDGTLYALDVAQRSFPLLDPNGRQQFRPGNFFEGVPFAGGFAYLRRLDTRRATVAVSDGTGALRYKFLLQADSAPLAALEWVGSDHAGNLYICLHLQIGEKPLRFQRELCVFNSSGELRMRRTLPLAAASWMDHPLAVEPSGSVLALFSLAGRFSLASLPAPSDEDGQDGTAMEWPAEFQAGYQPADFAVPESPASILPEPARNESLHREECLAIAYRYTRESWTAQACNIGTQVCGGTVQTPAWVAVGTHTKIPYDWGGWDSIDSFHRGIADCLKAGDCDTSGVGTCAVGVDCSGFVSRCWKTSQKYGTSTLDLISDEIALEAMRPGDVFNDAGSHVILFVRRNEDGSCLCVESHGGAWCVEETYKSAPPSGYIPRRYQQMLEGHLSGAGTAADPYLVPFLPYQDSWTTTGSPADAFDAYSCAPSINESGPEVLYRVDLPYWADLTGTVTDGPGVDVDVQILGAPDPADCLARGDTTATATGLGPGTYHVIADSWVGEDGTTYDGAYTLFLQASWPQGIGTFANPIRIGAFPFQHEGTTHNADSDAMDSYSCAPAVRESGPEVIYTFTTAAPGDLSVAVTDGTGVDIDIHLLDGAGADACLARADAVLGYDGLPAGTYWIAADSWATSGGVEYPGDYRLTVEFTPTAPPDTDGDGIPDSEDPEPLVRHGDVDNDGLVDAADALRLAHYLAGSLAAGQGGFDHPACADLHLDGNLRADDLAGFLDFLSGLLPTIPF